MSHGYEEACRCAFCGEHFSHSASQFPVVLFGAPSKEAPGTLAKLKPLRWRFRMNKAPCTKFICMACVRKKRQVPHEMDPSPVTDGSDPSPAALDASFHEFDGHKASMHEETYSRSMDQTLRSEQLELVPPERRRQSMPQIIANGQRQKLQAPPRDRCVHQFHGCQQLPDDVRRRRLTQPYEIQLETAPWSNVLHPFANHRVSKEAIERHRGSTVFDLTTQAFIAKQQASTKPPSRPRKPSNGHAEPRGSERKAYRLSSTADILGMSRSLELPPNYFDYSSSSAQISAARPPQQETSELKENDLDTPQGEQRSQRKSQDERQQQNDSYANMMERMRRHYNTVQVNGTHTHPATAPPRRIRAERAKSAKMARSFFPNDPEKVNSVKVLIDLDYLRAYKDAR